MRGAGREEWWPDWSGRPVVLVASGPSAAAAPLHLARGRCFVAAVNRSWELVPWADALYGADFAWWQSVEGCPDFAGLKFTRDGRAAETFGLRLLKLDGLIGRGDNSGQMLLDAALSFFNANPVILVGYDFSVADGLHWHGAHGGKLANPTPSKCKTWRRRLEAGARRLQGKTVFRCGAPALPGIASADFAEALDHCLRVAA